MPIQQIGGRNVYVITGTNTDPSKTSTGQSWANLVTQQKYMLFQEAQKQALQELQRADADYQTQVRMVQAQRRALQKEIAENKRVVQDMQSKQLTINDRRERANQRQANIGMRASTRVSSGGGSKGPTQISPNVSHVDAFYRKQIGDEQAKIDDIKRDIRSKEKSLDDVRGANENDATSSRGRRKKELLDELDQLNIKLQNAQTNRSLVESERDEFIEEYSSNKPEFDRKYRRLFGAKYQSGGRAPAPAQTTQAVDVEETQLEPVEVDVSPYQERIKELETELGALEMPTRESVDLIPRQSEIYQQYFGSGAAPVDRSAEMDVLGVTPEEPVAVQPSPEVVVEPQPEPVVEEPVVEEPQPRTYTVQPGDTLSQISQDVYGTPSRFMDIAEASGVQDPDVIREGQQLTVPPSPTPTLSDNREALNRIRALRLQPQRLSSIGRRMRLDDMQQPTAVESQQSTLKQKFEAVANQHPNQKKLLAMQLLQEYARDLGVTSLNMQKQRSRCCNNYNNH